MGHSYATVVMGDTCKPVASLSLYEVGVVQGCGVGLIQVSTRSAHLLDRAFRTLFLVPLPIVQVRKEARCSDLQVSHSLSVAELGLVGSLLCKGVVHGVAERPGAGVGPHKELPSSPITSVLGHLA